MPFASDSASYSATSAAGGGAAPPPSSTMPGGAAAVAMAPTSVAVRYDDGTFGASSPRQQTVRDVDGHHHPPCGGDESASLGTQHTQCTRPVTYMQQPHDRAHDPQYYRRGGGEGGPDARHYPRGSRDGGDADDGFGRAADDGGSTDGGTPPPPSADARDRATY
jgi:hypothetical protein